MIAPLVKRLNFKLPIVPFSPSLTFERAAQVHVQLPEPPRVKTMDRMASKVLISYAGSWLETKMAAAVEAAAEPMVQVVAV